MLRPIVSLIGALMVGPSARPMRYIDSGSVAAVVLTLNRSATCGMAGVYTDDPKVLPRSVYGASFIS